MEYIRVILSGILMASAVFTVLVTIYIFQKKNPSINCFAYFCLSVTFYSFGYAMELISSTLNDKLLWNLFQYIGLPFIPAFWILFSLKYNNKPVSLLAKISLFIIPITTVILRYTNICHYLYYSGVSIESNGLFPILYIEKGPWYWANCIYLTACYIISNYIYIGMYKRSVGTIRRQSTLMLIASFLPWTSLLLDLFNISPYNIDYGPYAVTSSVLLFFIAFLKYQFLNIKPLARDKVFESTNDGIIVLDENYHIIDYNLSAAAICATLNTDSIGKDAREVFKKNKPIIDSFSQLVESRFDCSSPKGNYKVNTVRILESEHREVGSIITFTDITKYMDMMAELNLLASRDALTGVYNRRYFVELSQKELEKAKRHHRPLSMMIMDLDFFKQVNDRYGHQAGDAVLQKLADICRGSIRSADILGRYGGEEFVILLPDTTLEDSRMISERILANVASAVIHYEGQTIQITASIGLTGVDTVTNQNLDYFLKFADNALYLAKSDGRNCVRTALL
ncbi:histidine kinase N-terminal 7TM domain-containing diguanylate cyclase [Acetanaerobacterium elongatum]|uniref:Diguanylate cyclase (GGDEF) domain-containing protein n=1 Tax=Acetanaerobacterium elongatum TaxID=258515 RepID=A0A1G9ZC44_9FIRM|nr:histidine kinase N-terminal 7TM domain-containing protein [Acetanaerobacterium elongatum]SDN19020.1 diguanylate cyclase (GGDEF) domain-containing protein [Acetanaerobacterium elongatum]